MAVQGILLLGDERLYETSAPVTPADMETILRVQADLKDTLAAFRAEYGFGRAIAAPQIGECVRMIYLKTGELDVTFLNPALTFPDSETMTLWDDCMSFPGLLVKLKRRLRCDVTYDDVTFARQTLRFSGDLSELVQHEVDHLDGILSVMRAENGKSFKMRP